MNRKIVNLLAVFIMLGILFFTLIKIYNIDNLILTSKSMQFYLKGILIYLSGFINYRTAKLLFKDVEGDLFKDINKDGKISIEEHF